MTDFPFFQSIICFSYFRATLVNQALLECAVIRGLKGYLGFTAAKGTREIRDSPDGTAPRASRVHPEIQADPAFRGPSAWKITQKGTPVNPGFQAFQECRDCKGLQDNRALKVRKATKE